MKDNGNETSENVTTTEWGCTETQQCWWGIDGSADLRSRHHGQKHAPKTEDRGFRAVRVSKIKRKQGLTSAGVQHSIVAMGVVDGALECRWVDRQNVRGPSPILSAGVFVDVESKHLKIFAIWGGV